MTEVMITVAIITVLASVGTYSWRQVSYRAQANLIISQIKSVQGAINLYRVDVHAWPPNYTRGGFSPAPPITSNPLMFPLGVAGWNGPYLTTYPELSQFGGHIGWGQNAGRIFIVVDDDAPGTNTNTGRIPREVLVIIDQSIDDGDLAIGNMTANNEEATPLSAVGELVYYIN